jgi:hypothetical protein
VSLPCTPNFYPALVSGNGSVYKIQVPAAAENIVAHNRKINPKNQALQSAFCHLKKMLITPIKP